MQNEHSVLFHMPMHMYSIDQMLDVMLESAILHCGNNLASCTYVLQLLVAVESQTHDMMRLDITDTWHRFCLSAVDVLGKS